MRASASRGPRAPAVAKEHGPHLLLRNDQLLADYFARRVVEARPVVLLPTLAYGFYPAFLEYPGSVSLAADTQRDVVAEIVLKFPLVAAEPPVYQRMAPEVVHLQRLGLCNRRIAKALAVDDKTVAKATSWIWDVR